MRVLRSRPARVPYSGVVTGLVAGTQVDTETEWDARDVPGGSHWDARGDGDVDLLLAFLNTVDIERGTDALADQATWRGWTGEHRLDPDGPGGLAAVRAARDALRDAVGGPVRTGVVALGGPPVRVELHAGVPVLAAGDAVGAALAAAARLAVLGRWDRVKICPADGCGWAFFDHSRNRSRTWCSMRVCGNRTKARNWRERARGRE